jgi:hypothetical protein
LRRLRYGLGKGPDGVSKKPGAVDKIVSSIELLFIVAVFFVVFYT